MNKKGFTLIELLAVIIILGILMIIAIPSVTSYISDSRKNAYVDTAKEIVGGARNIVNEGKLGMYDTKTTYYIPAKYVSTENSLKSPYGEFTKAYIGITYDGTGYKYYWISVDDAGEGINKIVLVDKLDTDYIVSDLKDSDIEDKIKTTGIGGRSNILILDENGKWSSPFQAEHYVSDNGELSDSDLENRTESYIIDQTIRALETNDIYLIIDLLPEFLKDNRIYNPSIMHLTDYSQTYGDNISMTYEVTSTTNTSNDLVDEINNYINSIYSVERTYSDCIDYNITINIKGSIQEGTDNYIIHICKYNNSLYPLFA